MKNTTSVLLLFLFAFLAPVAPAADIKQAFGAEQTLTVTSLHSLASSATAGWQSAVIDNTTNLYLETEISIVLDFANTAPANSRGVYVYMYRGVGTTYTNPATGTEGALTLLDVTANAQALQQVAFIPYTTADETVEYVFRVKDLPPKWGLALMNHSGAALAASGNTVKYSGVYYTSN
jgi:hypothetical protein